MSLPVTVFLRNLMFPYPLSALLQKFLVEERYFFTSLSVATTLLLACLGFLDLVDLLNFFVSLLSGQ